MYRRCVGYTYMYTYYPRRYTTRWATPNCTGFSGRGKNRLRLRKYRPAVRRPAIRADGAILLRVRDTCREKHELLFVFSGLRRSVRTDSVSVSIGTRQINLD